MNKLYIKLEHIKKSFDRPVLSDINLTVTNETYMAILGKSGSGKSTLMNILGLVESYDSGSYCFNGVKIKKNGDYATLRRTQIGFIFQSYNLIPTLTCEENIRLPLLYESIKDDERVKRLMNALDISILAKQRVTTLSGGEKQRVAIARALALNPCLILADEPTGNLDPKNRDIIFSVLREEHKNGRAVLVITHDEITAQSASRRMILEGGILRETT
jgi:ABC-type antimicrobial peptide transport system, ATPase component